MFLDWSLCGGRTVVRQYSSWVASSTASSLLMDNLYKQKLQAFIEEKT